MFYTNLVVFVHIPRTGGDHLTKWAQERMAISVDQHYLKHANYAAICEAIPQIGQLVPFTIVRDFEARSRSLYAHCRRIEEFHFATAEWRAFCLTAKGMTFEQFMQSGLILDDREYLTQDGLVQFNYEPDLLEVKRWLLQTHSLPQNIL